jgi:L-iditol 2-dehydrogenase
MRAAFLVAPSTIELRSVPDPTCPEDGLLLAVRACGICGSDLRRWREGPTGGFALTDSAGGDVIPGHEVAGTVLEVGPRVSGWAPGDDLALAPDVHCGHCYFCRHGRYNLCDNLRAVGITPGYPGGLAERMALTGEVLTNGIVHHMPPRMSHLHAALAEPCASVLAAHERARTSPADTVVVIGAGPVGCTHIAVAKARGARVIVSQRSQRRRELAQRFAPDYVIDPTREDVVARVRALTEGRGADIVICANPVGETQPQAVEMVRKGGQVLLFGGLPKAKPMVTLDANRIHYGEITVVGSFSYHPTMHALALDVIRRRLVPADRLITHTYPLERVAEAFAMAASGEALKVVVTVGE